jgi:hypothetical protein
MSRRDPLALSTEQLELITGGARQLPVDLRSKYLSLVADNLLGREVDDDAVAQAVVHALERLLPPSAA